MIARGVAERGGSGAAVPHFDSNPLSPDEGSRWMERGRHFRIPGRDWGAAEGLVLAIRVPKLRSPYHPTRFSQSERVPAA